MKINEITNTLKTYKASVKLKNGSWVKTSVDAENSSQAMQLLKHLYTNVSSVSELVEQVSEIEEGTKTLTPQQLQVKSLADQAAKFKKQKEQLVAKQSLAKAQAKVRDASRPSV